MSIEDSIGYRFKDSRLLAEALTHPSCAEHQKNLPFNYQRLEFLGDSVLGVVAAEMLYRLFPGENEGSLAKRHAALVCSESIATVARTIGLGAHMRLGAGEHGGRENTSNLEDVCEALLGALYLDGGFDVAKKFILAHWESIARKASAPPKDAKTALQEWAQGLGLKLPAYTVTQTTGPAHAPEFTVEVSVEGKPSEVAKAASKRQAEQIAARALLDKIGKQ